MICKEFFLIFVQGQNFTPCRKKWDKNGTLIPDGNKKPAEAGVFDN
jgi:hypothetical protein